MNAAIYTIIVYLLTTVLFTCKFTILGHMSKNHSVTVTGAHRRSIIVYQSRHIYNSLVPAYENLYRVTVRENLSTRRVYSISTKKCFNVRACEHFEQTFKNQLTEKILYQQINNVYNIFQYFHAVLDLSIDAVCIILHQPVSFAVP